MLSQRAIERLHTRQGLALLPNDFDDNSPSSSCRLGISRADSRRRRDSICVRAVARAQLATVREGTVVMMKARAAGAQASPGTTAFGALLARTRDGDRTATQNLLYQLKPSLERYLRRRLPANHDIDDALQDSLLAILAALPSYRGEANLLHFAIQVARRSTLFRQRTERRAAERSARVAELELPLVNPMPGPHERSLESRRTAEIRKLVGELSAAHAETLALAIVCEHSLAEVAEATGVPINTVRSRLGRARRWLRSRIEADSTLAELLCERR